MQTGFGRYQNHAENFCCAKCGAKGAMIWEDGVVEQPHRKSPIRVNGPFYERISVKKPYHVEIVCSRCDTPQKPHASQFSNELV